jgi:hypothetical protein
MMKWIRAFVLGLAVVVTTGISSVESSPDLLKARARSEEVALQLRDCHTLAARSDILLKTTVFQETLSKHPKLQPFLTNISTEQCYVLALMVALDQFDTVFNGFDTIENKPQAVKKLLSTLVDIEKFYEPIGGILGYHTTVIKLMTASEPSLDAERYAPPPYQDIRTKTPEVWAACYDGAEKLGRAASIFALGGAGDRLNLIDEATKEPLPAARLLFCGRSLFEGLMRDIEAQEYWHYRVFGDRVTMPILIMTSKEKNNDSHIEAMGKEANWFGHRHDAIRRITQPLVPVIDTEGQWAVSAPLELALKPGGHGVLWKLAEDSGAIKWLTFRGIDAAIVRQVNNPLAGLDQAIPTFIGYGLSQNKSFGFLSCPSKPGFAEGLNVLSVKKKGASAQAAISNIEYTQFAILKNLLPTLFQEGACPANTNILYINLHEIKGALARDPIPGMIVNAKTNVDVMKGGHAIKKIGGRLESCMQNIADGLMTPISLDMLPSVRPEALPTFLLLQDREKLMSATKKAYQPGQSPVETTAACLYDWNRAMRSLLTSSCHFTLPKEQTLDEFLRDGPSVIFSFHPAMGPLWDVIGQKLSHGMMAEGAELELEIAEIASTDLSLDGSLRIVAHTPTGPINGVLGRKYTDKVGRARLSSVSIVNRGLKSRDVSSVLKGTMDRHESCEIILEGFSEVVASNVIVSGNFSLVVPDGQRAIISNDQEGNVVVTFEAIATPGWQYAVDWKRSSAPKLQLKEAS